MCDCDMTCMALTKPDNRYDMILNLNLQDSVREKTTACSLKQKVCTDAIRLKYSLDISLFTRRLYHLIPNEYAQITRFVWPTWSPPGGPRWSPCCPHESFYQGSDCRFQLFTMTTCQWSNMAQFKFAWYEKIFLYPQQLWKKKDMQEEITAYCHHTKLGPVSI